MRPASIVVIIETVGVGQSEVDACAIADTAVFVASPGMGDDAQAIKAGIIEVADVFAVNKADRPGAATARRHLRAASSDRSSEEGQWKPTHLPDDGHHWRRYRCPARFRR